MEKKVKRIWEEIKKTVIFIFYLSVAIIFISAISIFWLLFFVY